MYHLFPKIKVKLLREKLRRLFVLLLKLLKVLFVSKYQTATAIFKSIHHIIDVYIDNIYILEFFNIVHILVNQIFASKNQ